MSAPLPAPAIKPKSRHARRLFIPLFLILFLVIAFGITYVRGTWTDAQPRNPSGVADGPLAQLYEAPDGPTVRCAILLPYPPDRVWAVVSDYSQYGEFVPYLHDLKAERADHATKLSGNAAAVFVGTWPFAVTIQDGKETNPSPHWRAAWDEKSDAGKVAVNRGSWEVWPAGDNQTLLVLSLKAEVRGTPTFVLNNFFLHRLKVVVRNVDKRLKSQAP